MAVNGIRVSALPVMEVADLTNNDYLIINDENTNTRRISFGDFTDSVNTNLHDKVVFTVNGFDGNVTIGAAEVGAPTIAELAEVASTAGSAETISGSNVDAIVLLDGRIVALETDPTTATAVALKANSESPTFTGTVAGITQSMVGLGNVSNTADADKPVSTATTNAIDAVANIANANTAGAALGVTSLQDDTVFATSAQGTTADANATLLEALKALTADGATYATADALAAAIVAAVTPTP